MVSPVDGRIRSLAAALPLDRVPRFTCWLLAAAAAIPLPLIAQLSGASGDGFLFRRPAVSFAVRGGYDRPLAGSDIFDFTTTQLTLDRRDFAAFAYQVDLGVRLSDRWEIVLSGGDAKRSVPSEFRTFVDNNERPIEQSTTLRRAPITLGVNYALTAPGDRIGKFAWIPARFSPWVGVGVGRMNYSFSQVGDFVDFQTLRVFSRTFRSSGMTPLGYGRVGADFMLTQRIALTGDLRYTAAQPARMSEAFQGFRKIDLSGGAATMGFTVRY